MKKIKLFSLNGRLIPGGSEKKAKKLGIQLDRLTIKALKPKDTAAQYPGIYDLISGLCHGLKINEPDLTIADYDSPLLRPGMWAQVLHRQDYRQLKRSLLIINRVIIDCPELLTGVIMHELTHIHQMEYTPDIFAIGEYGHIYAYGKDVYTNPAEIDADAMGICVMSLITGYDIEDCAATLCPDERREAPEAYDIRVQYAYINYANIKNKIIKLYG